MLLKIFMIFFRLGFIAFGGGYSIIPLIEREVVDKHQLIDRDRFISSVSITNGLPGAIALNVSIFVGFTVKKFPGALVAALGSMLPSLIIMSTIMLGFSNISDLPVVQSAMAGIRPVVIALILYAAYKIGKRAYKNIGYFVLTLIGFALAMFARNIPIPLIVVGGLAVGILLNMVETMIKAGQNEKK